MMTDIFLSYARKDEDAADQMVQFLERQGFSVWWDKLIPEGNDWNRKIEDAIYQARCVIVLWTPQSLESNAVLNEALYAKEEQKILPVRLEDVRVPLLHRTTQHCDLLGWKGGEHPGLEDLRKALATRLSKQTEKNDGKPAAAPPRKPAATSPNATTKDNGADRGGERRQPGKRAWFLGIVLLTIGASLAVWWSTTWPTSIPEAPIEPAPRPPGEVTTSPADGLPYVWIPPGEFQMGCSPDDKACANNEKPSHSVRISEGFWLGQTEVTQAAYEKVTGETPSRFKGARLPVEQVNWDEARKYCEAVGGRLPTEAEWEYAARAGSTQARYGNLGDIAWFEDNSEKRTHDVGTKLQYAWQLYDMLGNVREWTSDRYGSDYYKVSPSTDPEGPVGGEFRVARGGSWFNLPRSVRASNRNDFEPGLTFDLIGFRCAWE